MTVTTNQKCCSQIWVVMEVITEITGEVLAEVASGERVNIIDMYQRYRRVLAWFSTQQIYKVADGVRIVYSGERTGVINMLLTGLNSSGGVIIVADASRFERVENGERAGVIKDI